jgi:hypothetical protein
MVSAMISSYQVELGWPRLLISDLLPRLSLLRREATHPSTARAPDTARTSEMNSSGCSQAPKWPPRSGSPQWTIDGNRGSAHRRKGLGISCGKTVHPVGTVMRSPPGLVNQAITSAMLSQYNRADEAAVRVSQYNVMLSSTWSGLRTSQRAPWWSDQAHTFSRIQAQSPTGDSTREYPSV